MVSEIDEAGDCLQVVRNGIEYVEIDTAFSRCLYAEEVLAGGNRPRDRLSQVSRVRGK
jgi:hypothetical protein